jgi:hypothetical protein
MFQTVRLTFPYWSTVSTGAGAGAGGGGGGSGAGAGAEEVVFFLENRPPRAIFFVYLSDTALYFIINAGELCRNSSKPCIGPS